MVGFQEVVTVDAPVADVVRVLQAVERWPSWTATMTRVDRSATGPLAVGQTAVVKQPKLRVARYTVTAVDASGFAWESSIPGLRMSAEHWARDTDDGRTEVTLRFALSGPLSRPLGVLYGRLIQRYLGIEAAGLRREVDGSG